MACFLVPAGEAVVTTVVQKVVENREKKAGGEGAKKTGLNWSRRLGWLNKLLWGGTILLALEHIWHGEVVPWPPFLTAMNNPAEVAPMLREMATIGVAIALFVTIVWAIIVLIVELRAKAKAMPAAKVSPAGGGG
jgi:fatty acid desaturase